MKIIKNKIAFIVGLVGLIGGVIWAFASKFSLEPIILATISLVEVIGYFLLSDLDSSENSSAENGSKENKNKQNVNVNVSVGESPSKITTSDKPVKQKSFDRNCVIETMQSKTSILFIDDDKKFNVVKILKDSNWKKVKTVVDIKSLDIPVVKDANLVFVDINGVGKLLALEFEGLDLALMLKQRYPDKKIIIYSANRNNNSFHKAWDFCDFKLEKNALPYQFQNLVEEYSIELFKSKE